MGHGAAAQRVRLELVAAGNSLTERAVNGVASGGSKESPVMTEYNCGKAGRGPESLSEFERTAISHVKRLSKKHMELSRPTFLDIGTGSGMFATELVGAGARVVALDRENNLMDAAVNLLGQGRIRFVEKSIEALSRSDLPREIHGVTAMRVLHWVRHADAERCLRVAASAMPTGSQLFFSVAMLDGRLGAGYPLSEKTPLSARYAEPDTKYKEFSHPVTLYTPAEAANLAEKAGYNVSRLSVTRWGLCNIRATLQDKNRKFFSARTPVPLSGVG